jgi:hypothetical protein
VPPAATNDPSVPLQQKDRVISFTFPPDTPKCMFLVWYCAFVSTGVQTIATATRDSRDDILSFIWIFSFGLFTKTACKKARLF